MFEALASTTVKLTHNVITSVPSNPQNRSILITQKKNVIEGFYTFQNTYRKQHQSIINLHFRSNFSSGKINFQCMSLLYN